GWIPSIHVRLANWVKSNQDGIITPKKVITTTFVLIIKPIMTKKLNSEQFDRNPVLLVRQQTVVSHQILRRISSSEFRHLSCSDH
ncbi:MAG: hypothetical protein PVJ77_20225, partial [Desulfobacterales bacterium]